MALAVCTVGLCGSNGRFVSCGGRRKVGGGGGRGPSRVVCSAAAASSSSPYYAGSLAEHYRMLRIQPGASECEVKKAFRQLALQYHPDVCKGDNCGVQFHRINEAYDSVMSSLRRAEAAEPQGCCDDGYVDDEQMRGMQDPSWELWEEWMGWEGAGILDYSSHINPYL